MALAAIYSLFLDLLFPPQCVKCRKVGTVLCTACIAQIRQLGPLCCRRCGAPLQLSPQQAHFLEAPTNCSACPRFPFYLNCLRIAVEYRSPVREAIHALKYKRQRHLASPLGQVLSTAYTSYQLQVDVLVPVPLHARRQAERGFNQSLLLAQEVGRRLQLPVQSLVVQRKRYTRPQVGLSIQERQSNVAGAFTCTAAATKLIQGKRVLLIDDVSTTGATLNECARALQDAGAAWVGGLALARSGFHS